jgi:hypothetical protein
MIIYLSTQAAWAEGAPPLVPAAGFVTNAWMRVLLVAE